MLRETDLLLSHTSVIFRQLMSKSFPKYKYTNSHFINPQEVSKGPIYITLTYYSH